MFPKNEHLPFWKTPLSGRRVRYLFWHPMAMDVLVGIEMKIRTHLRSRPERCRLLPACGVRFTDLPQQTTLLLPIAFSLAHRAERRRNWKMLYRYGVPFLSTPAHPAQGRHSGQRRRNRQKNLPARID